MLANLSRRDPFLGIPAQHLLDQIHRKLAGIRNHIAPSLALKLIKLKSNPVGKTDPLLPSELRGRTEHFAEFVHLIQRGCPRK